MTKIAVIDKCPNRCNYSKSFGVKVDTHHMTSQKVKRMKKADIDIDINLEDYDWVILIGAEAAKYFTKVTAVSNYTGKRVESKDGSYKNFLISISPAMLYIKPDMQPVFDKTVIELHKHMDGLIQEKAPVDYAPLQTTEAINEYLNFILRMPLDEFPAFALDTEDSGLYARKCWMLGVSISHKTHQGVYMDADYFDEYTYQLLQEIIDTPGRAIVLHNLKFDMHMMGYHLGLDFNKAHEEKRLHDTMVMHYILDERQGTHGLKALVMKYTDMGDYDRELDEFKTTYCKTHGIKKEDFSYDLIPFEIMWKYAAGDTDGTLRLFFKFWKVVQKNEKLLWLYENLMMPATMFLHRMEERGLPLSTNRLHRANEYLQMTLLKLEEKLYSYPEVMECEGQLGVKFNPNSVQQLRHLLFNVIGLAPTGIMTDTGADSTDKEVLAKLGEQHEIPNLILTIKQTTKLISSFIVKLIDNVDKDGRIRTNFGCTTTTSGRLSSSGTFNAQQLPRDNPIVKGCVVARPGYKIIAYDLTTAEVYYAAVLSGDRNLQQVFIDMTNEPDKYADYHSTIAHKVFKLKCKPNEVKSKMPAMRQAAKAVNFGILYGSGPASVAESVNMALLEQSMTMGTPFVPCTVEDAKGFIADYFKMFPRLKKWVDASHEQIRQCGYLYSFYGRKRRLLNYKSADRGVVSGEIRSGFNAIIQSASSDSLVLGTIAADKEIMSRGLDAQIIGLVHDSVICEVRIDQVDDYIELLVRNVQDQKFNGWDDAPLEIPTCPVGIENDSEVGGSYDYSCGKMDKKYPFISAYENPDMQNKIVETLELMKSGWKPEKNEKGYYVDGKAGAIFENAQLCLEAIQDIGIAA